MLARGWIYIYIYINHRIAGNCCGVKNVQALLCFQNACLSFAIYGNKFFIYTLVCLVYCTRKLAFCNPNRRIAIETQYTATNLLIKVLQTLRVLGVPTHTLTEYYAGCFPSFLQPGNEATLVQCLVHVQKIIIRTFLPSCKLVREPSFCCQCALFGVGSNRCHPASHINLDIS